LRTLPAPMVGIISKWVCKFAMKWRTFRREVADISP